MDNNIMSLLPLLMSMNGKSGGDKNMTNTLLSMLNNGSNNGGNNATSGSMPQMLMNMMQNNKNTTATPTYARGEGLVPLQGLLDKNTLEIMKTLISTYRR